MRHCCFANYKCCVICHPSECLAYTQMLTWDSVTWLDYREELFLSDLLLFSHYGSSALKDLNGCHGTFHVVKLQFCIFLRKAVSDPTQNSTSGKDNRWQDKRRRFVVGSRGRLGIQWQTLDSDTSPQWMGKSGELSDLALFWRNSLPSHVLSHSLTLSGAALTDRRRRPDLKQVAVWSSPCRFHSVTKSYTKSLNIRKDYYSENKLTGANALYINNSAKIYFVSKLMGQGKK